VAKCASGKKGSPIIESVNGKNAGGPAEKVCCRKMNKTDMPVRKKQAHEKTPPRERRGGSQRGKTTKQKGGGITQIRALKRKGESKFHRKKKDEVSACKENRGGS